MCQQYITLRQFDMQRKNTLKTDAVSEQQEVFGCVNGHYILHFIAENYGQMYIPAWKLDFGCGAWIVKTVIYLSLNCCYKSMSVRPLVVFRWKLQCHVRSWTSLWSLVQGEGLILACTSKELRRDSTSTLWSAVPAHSHTHVSVYHESKYCNIPWMVWVKRVVHYIWIWSFTNRSHKQASDDIYLLTCFTHLIAMTVTTKQFHTLSCKIFCSGYSHGIKYPKPWKDIISDSKMKWFDDLTSNLINQK